MNLMCQRRSDIPRPGPGLAYTTAHSELYGRDHWLTEYCIYRNRRYERINWWQTENIVNFSLEKIWGRNYLDLLFSSLDSY